MKRLLFLGGAAALVAVFLGVFSQTPRVTEADTFDLVWDVEFCDTLTPGDAQNSCAPGAGSTTNGANPSYITHLAIDPPFPGTPGQPFFDLATTTWTPNLMVHTGIDLGAYVGEINFSIRSNQNITFPGNINPLTGAPPACGALGTLNVTPNPAFIHNSVVTPTDPPVMTAGGFNHSLYVQSFDDDDNDLVEYTTGVDGDDGGDTLPETQGDDNGNNIPDGVERMPDFIPRLLAAAGLSSVFQTRGYAIAEVVANVSEVDVNFIGINLTGLGGGYLSITTIGVVDPAAVYNPATAAQTTLTCAPFESHTTTYGVSVANPVGGVPGGDIVRSLDNTKLGGGTVEYIINVSSAEDYDADGVPDGVDRCDTDAAAGATDTDGDGLSGTCDPNPGSADNNGGGLAVNTSYPWTGDQDVDGDGVHNFADNCPNTANPDQRDSDSDTVGNACDPKPALGNARSGVPNPGTGYDSAWVQNGHDHDSACNDPVVIGGGAELDDAGAGTTCNPALTVTNADASDDGVQNSNAGAAALPYGAGAGHQDYNSDSDADGVSDGEESDGDGNCDGNALNSDTDGDNTLDGAETSPAATPCWAFDAANSTSSLVPNKNGRVDSDGDGCSNNEEALANQGQGGNRDATWPYDFTDVPGPTVSGSLAPTSTKNRSVALTDVLVVLDYSGASSAKYNADGNLNGVPDGRELDFTPAGGGRLANAPNGNISLQDVLVVLSQSGNSCAAL